MPHKSFSRKDDLNKSFWENIHFGRLVIQNGVNRMIIQFAKTSIPPSSHYSIHPFLQTILVENSQCGKDLNQFRPPNSSDDLCLLFCLYPLFITYPNLVQAALVPHQDQLIICWANSRSIFFLSNIDKLSWIVPYCTGEVRVSHPSAQFIETSIAPLIINRKKQLQVC